MIRTLAALTCIAGLSACTGGAPAPTGGTATAVAADGQAAKLTAGMSENDAFAVFGPEAGFERNPADFDETCLSFAYGDATAPRFVHAVFRAGALVGATDGHAALCTYASAIPDA